MSETVTAIQPDKAAMEKINLYTRRAYKPEEVYTFSVVLCDNEVDRDGECFTKETLEELAKLFVGKTGILDHEPTSKNQTARVFDAAVKEIPGKVTSLNEPYAQLTAQAYVPRNDGTKAFIESIESGIRKEVSVGCAVKKRVCSVCGAENGACGHVKGQMYGEKLCFMELKDPKDAYEWSFVAVPAQPRAGVVKRFGSEGTELRMLRKQAELGQRYLTGLRREVVRLAMLADGHLDGKIFTKAVGRLDEAELLELKRAYEAQIAKKFPVAPQLRQQAETKREDEAVFLV